MTTGPGFSVPLFNMGSYSEVRQGEHLVKHNHKAVKGEFISGCPKCDGLKISMSRGTPPHTRRQKI